MFKKEEDGFAAVETLIGLVVFVICVVSIMALANIAATESRIYYTLEQTAEEISVYFYVLNAIGSDSVKDEENLSESQEKIRNSANGKEKLKDNINAIKNNIAQYIYPENYNEYEDTESNYENDLNIILDYYEKDIEKDINIDDLLEIYAGEVFKKYLPYEQDVFERNNGISGGISFANSRVFDVDDNNNLGVSPKAIEIVAKYDISSIFGGLFRTPFKINVVQRVKTLAWLNGAKVIKSEG